MKSSLLRHVLGALIFMLAAPEALAASLSMSNITMTTLDLTISSHTGSWYYTYQNFSTGTTSNCSSEITGTTANVTGLTENTIYNFKAYSDSGCSSQLATGTQTTEGFYLDPAQMFLTEGGNASQLRIVVPTITESLTATVSASPANKVTLSSSQVTFTVGGVRTQGITVTPLQDADGLNEGITFTVEVTSGQSNLLGDTYTSRVRIDDDDSEFTLSKTAVTLTEGAGSGTYTLKLASDPADQNVTVTVTSSDTGAVTVDTDGGTAGNQSSITFTGGGSGNWNTVQTITLAPVDDTDESHETVTITHSTSSSLYQAADKTTTVTVVDDEATQLTASAVAATTATLTLTNHSGAWYYKYSSPTGGSCSSVVSSGTTTANLTSLTTGTSYTYKAYSDNSCSTELTSATTDADFLTKPGQVAGVGATADDASLSVSWTALTGTVTGYKVQWKSGQDNYNTVDRQKTVTSGTSTSITGLTNDTTYTVRVTAYNGTGDGAASAEVNGTPVTETLTASAVTTTTATLTLTNHSGAWYYKYSSPTGGSCSSVVSSGTTTANLTSLTTGTSYTYKAYSDSSCSTELTSAATDAEFSTVGLTATSVTSSGATLTLANWTAAWWYKGNQTNASCTAVAANTTTASLTGLTGGTSYAYTVYSAAGCNATNEIADAAFTTTAAVAPPAPTGLTGAQGNRQVTLTWTSGGDGGSAITKWQYVKKAGNGDFETTWNNMTGSGAGTTSHTVTGLTNGTAYKFKVRAVNSVGNGTESAESSAVTPVIGVCDRTAEVREAIVSMVVGKTTCSAITDADLAGILRLPVNNTSSLTALQSGDFAGLTALKQLLLNDSSLASLPANVFDTLTTLEELLLTNNSLSSLPAGIFDELTALKKLYLDENSLSSLPADIFDTLTALEELDLSDNSLSSLPANVFDKLTVLLELRLNNNSLSSLPPRIFDKLTDLDWLFLKNNSLSSLSAGVFDKLSWLSWLTLGGNGLTCLPFIPGYDDGYVLLDVEDSARNTACGAGVTVDASAVNVGVGMTAAYTMVLDAYPRGDVTVTPASAAAGTATVSGALTFTQSNWSTAQEVTVTGVAAGSATVSHTVSGGGYGSTTADDVSVSVKTVTLEASEVTTTTATLTVKYSTNPSPYYYKRLQPSEGDCEFSITTTLALTGLTAGTSYTYAFYGAYGNCSTEETTEATRATFTTKSLPAPDADPVLSSSSSTASTATLTIANYSGSWYYKRTAPTAGDHPYDTCSVAVDGTSVELTDLRAATSYSFTAYRDSGCTNSIDSISFTTAAPSPAVNLSTRSLTLREGSTATYTVRLNTQPTDTVTVAVGSSDTTVATVSPASLSFTTSNWEQPQSVTVTGQRDADTQDEAVTISHSAAGGGYDAVAEAVLGVNVSDEDVRGVSLSPESLTLTEGSTATYTVRLNTQPTDTVTVAVGSSDTTVATVSPASLSFTTSNWEQPQSVTVTGQRDADTQDEAVTISHSAAGGGYDAVAEATLGVNVSDEDVRGVSLSPESLTLREGSTATYTVRLNTQPTDTVTVAVGSNDTTVATVSPASLSFTTSNWEQPQSVMVTGVDNAVAGQNGAATISHEPAGGGYDAVAEATLGVNVSDDDVRGVSLSPESLTLTEGSTATYTVVLDSEPTDTVTVAVGSNDTTVATVSPASLSFTTSNWEQPQSVTVTGQRDADTQDGATTISHEPSGGGYGGLASPMVTVTVEDLGAQVSQRVNQVAEEVTPEVNRVVSANTAHAVAQRVSQVVQGRLPLAGTQISWGSLPNTAQGAMELARRWAVDGETISVAALLDNSSFNTSFPPQSQAAATEMGDGNAPSFPWGVWGAVDYGQIASGDDDNTTEWDAGVLTALVGADRMVNDRLLAGAALAWSSSSFDYQTNGRGGDLVEGKGEGSIELFTINPYLGWRLDDGQSLWTSVGYGWGALTIDDNVEARETSTDLTQWSLAAGASGVFYQSSQSSRATELEAAATSQLLWKADAWFSSLQVAGKDLLHDDQQQAYRLRLGVEGNRAIPLDNQALLTPSLGLFYRYEGGDGTTGSGLDLAAALRYDTPNGLRLEGRGRTLLLHSEELKDWGISGLVRYSPRGDDGFSLSLSPKWGRTDTNDLQQLWSTHQDQFSTTGDVSSALLLDAELRSPKLAMGSYVLTPALGFQFSPDAWTTRLGTALQFNSSLNLQLDLSRQQPEEGHVNHSLGLNLEMEF